MKRKLEIVHGDTSLEFFWAVVAAGAVVLQLWPAYVHVFRGPLPEPFAAIMALTDFLLYGIMVYAIVQLALVMKRSGNVPVVALAVFLIGGFGFLVLLELLTLRARLEFLQMMGTVNVALFIAVAFRARKSSPSPAEVTSVVEGHDNHFHDRPSAPLIAPLDTAGGTRQTPETNLPPQSISARPSSEPSLESLR